MLGVLAGEPLLVVDLDSIGDAASLLVPVLLPCVTVGVSRGHAAQAGLDVVLTTEPAPPAPWVGVDDVDSALNTLGRVTASTPVTAATLVQVLRAGRSDSLAHDLLLESLAYSTLQGGPEFASWKQGRPRRHLDPEDQLPVTTHRDGPTLAVTLNRPHVHNAYNAAMRDALCEALSLATLDATITEIELRGAGPSFCSGGDLDEFGAATDPASAHLVRTARSAAARLAGVADRTTAYLHGACVGAGIELPALARRVIADADTRIELPEVAMGLIPGAGGTASIPRRIGRHRTAWMALTGQTVDAETALAWGLVDEIKKSGS